jgi:type II secretory pathway component PulF
MPLVQTPGLLARRAELYHQLGQLTNAGIGLLKALDIQRRSPPSVSFREPLTIILDDLGRGATFSEAVKKTGSWMPEFDGALIQAGEQSGRLPSCFELLAEHYNERSRLAKQMLSDSAYPFFLFHFAIFIGPFPELFASGKITPYLAKTFGELVPVYAVVFVILFATKQEHGEKWRALIERLLQAVPFLGAARRNMSLARLSAALEALLSAGVNIVEAWDLAAAASGSPFLSQQVARMKPLVQAGQTPAEAMATTRAFPETFEHLYATGEISGQLEQSLKRARGMFQEEASRKLSAFSKWLPKVVYFLVVIMIAWRIISFWLGYFGEVNKAINF